MLNGVNEQCATIEIFDVKILMPVCEGDELVPLFGFIQSVIDGFCAPATNTSSFACTI